MIKKPSIIPSKINKNNKKPIKDLSNRKSRGLRMLSLKVRDIVFNEKKSSYKYVAEKLIQNLSYQSQ